MDKKLLNLLQNCRSIKQLKQTHLQILINGLQDCNFILPKLITLSSDLISIDYATNVFQTSSTTNLIAFNTMIKCFIGKSHREALHTYNQMKLALIAPNSFTFTFLLTCVQSLKALKDGTMVHGDTVKWGFGSSVFVQNSLLDFYAKCGGSLDSACLVFDEMPQRDVVSWNTMIGAYMAHGMVEESIRLFDVTPERNIVTWNSVIGGLAKAGNMDLAHSLFKSMPVRNGVSWNSMISGYIRVGDVETARSVFDQMPEKTVVSWTAMISGYTTIGDLESARAFFYQMPGKNVVSWNAMIACYVHNHKFDEALSVFHHMLIDGVCRPDQTTLLSVLSACAHLGSLEHGKWIDSYITKNKIELSNPLGNALIDMFAKCGDVEKGRAVFDQMANRCIITWTAMISGLAVNGQSIEALALFERMCLERIKPDDVIFIAVLSACTHGGLVKEGRRVFDQMVSEFGIEPRIEHYGCMVDLLARAGKLEEAIRFIESMHMEPNTIIWATVLSACKIHGNGELLESVSRKIIDQEPSNPSYLTLVTNLSSSVGRWEDALNFRVAMRRSGVDKVPGCSSIQIGNTVHEFLAKDSRHERRREIYRVLDSLNGNMKTIYEVQ